MRTLRQQYSTADGRYQKTEKWYVEFRDQHGREQRLPGFTNRAATDELGRNIEKLVAYFMASGGHVAPELQVWLVGLPRSIRERLIKIGLVDARRVAVSKPLREHLDDFLTSRRAKGTSEKQVILLEGRLKRIFDACKFVEWTDVTGERFMNWLGRRRQSTKDASGNEELGISAQTFNFYQQTMKQFCRWAVLDRRISESPVQHLTGLNIRLDRRHDRRALSAAEQSALISNTWDEPVRFGMTGPERSMLYRLACETGLRVG